MNPALQNILSRLQKVKKVGNGWQACCPAHADRAPSLRIDEGKDGRVLLKCFAGCDTKDIVAALGLRMTDLFPRPQPPGDRDQKTYYNYKDADGKLLFRVVRTPDKKFFQQRPDNNGGWVNGLGGIRPVLYRLPEVIKAVEAGETVFVPEGEKDVNNLIALGLTATCNPMGAGKWRSWYSDSLKGANAVLLPDNDEPGRQHTRQVARSLKGKAKSVKVLELPGLADKGDVSDWLANGGTKDELLELAAAAPEWQPSPVEQGQHTDGDGEQKDKKPTQAELLIMLANDAELFHTPEDTSFATIPVSGHRETWPIRNKGFRRWLLQRFYEAEGKPPSAQAMQDALGVLEAKAYFEGQERPALSRLAELDGKIYLDLGGDSWEAIEITPDGWRVISNPPVKFKRSKGMLPLPQPIAGGTLEDLRQFVNIGSEEDWRLMLAWLVAAMRPTGPYPVLVLQGEQGSAKSTTAKVLRSLVDPNIAPLRTTPREERDLAIAANNSWVLSFDNLSGVALWLSDALCRVATGGGFATRTLYENDEETIFDYVRPIIVNGIDEIVTRHDLLDRSLVVTLPVISDDQRQDEETFWEAFAEARPKILGALMDAVAAGLQNIDKVHLEELPRMADFAKWVTAVEPALPWEAGGFMAAYSGKRAEAVELALEGDVVAVAVKSLVAHMENWEGNATELLETLKEYVPEQTQKTKAWPKTARTMANRIRRAATFLRQTGVEVEFYREGGTGRRLIRISKDFSVTNVTSVTGTAQPQTGHSFEGVTQNVTQHQNVTQVSSQAILASQPQPRRGAGCDEGDACDARKHSLSTPWGEALEYVEMGGDLAANERW